MRQLSLLIVEDKKSQRKLYNDSIEDFNSRSEDIKISPYFVENLKDGQDIIRIKPFDAAIVDLKLRNDSEELDGATIIREIKNELRFPIYVLSDLLGELEVDLQEPSAFYKVYNSTSKDSNELFKEIADLYKTGITNILGKKGIIETRLQQIFWKHINSSIDLWKAGATTDCEKILSRHIINYLYEYLQLDEEGNFDNYNVEEMYIMPPIRNKKHTGDLLEKEGKHFIILSPACDMACGKAEPVTIAEIEKLDMKYLQDQVGLVKSFEGNIKQLTLELSKESANKEEINRNISTEEKKKQNVEKKIESLLSNSDAQRYYFLPSSSKFSGGFINFQKVSSFNLSELETNFKVLGRVAESFLKEIIARFSNYYSRQGQPDFDVRDIKDKLVAAPT